MALPQGKPDRSQMQGTRKRAMEVRAPILVEARLMGVNRCAKLRAEQIPPLAEIIALRAEKGRARRHGLGNAAQEAVC